MNPPASSLPDRRLRVLAAAAGLFARWGFDKTNVEDIAREAGISKGAVYLEFPAKEAVFQAVLHREFGRYVEDWRRRFEADPGEWSFARMFQHSLAALQANPLMRALLTRDRRVFGRFLREDGGLSGAVIAVRTEMFGKLQRLGAMRDDIPPEVVAYLVSAIGYGVATSDEVVPEKNKVPLDEVLGALGLLLDRGLAPLRVKNRREARKVMLDALEKMREALSHDF